MISVNINDIVQDNVNYNVGFADINQQNNWNYYNWAKSKLVQVSLSRMAALQIAHC